MAGVSVSLAQKQGRISDGLTCFRTGLLCCHDHVPCCRLIPPPPPLLLSPPGDMAVIRLFPESTTVGPNVTFNLLVQESSLPSAVMRRMLRASGLSSAPSLDPAGALELRPAQTSFPST